MVQSIAVGDPSSSSAMIVSTETEYRGPLLTVILDTASGAGLRKNIQSVTIWPYWYWLDWRSCRSCVKLLRWEWSLNSVWRSLYKIVNHLVMFPCSGCQASVTRGRGNTWSTRHVTFTSPPRDTCCSTGPLPGSGQSGDVLLLSYSLTAAAHRTQRGGGRLSHPGRMSPRGSGTRLQHNISTGAPTSAFTIKNLLRHYSKQALKHGKYSRS